MLGHELFGGGPRRVIVLNDWLCDTSTWEDVRAYLDVDAVTWAFADLRGYGRSREQTGSFTLAEAAADVVALADRLGWDRYTVVGHSMSTLVAAHVAQTQPSHVEKAILVTPPPPRGFGYDDAIHARLREVALGDDAMRAKALDMMLGDRLGAAWKRFKIQRWRATSEPAAVAAYVAMFGVDGMPDPVTPITCPVLAIAGEHDAPPMRSEAVARAFAALCPSLTTVAIAESGHYPMQETPPLFAASVQRFLMP
ncbi:MAG: alpha/beta hydrolase [Deltaproteobacteria bacterium]|nr:alpha/beta hydrolase [Deltaproteobacteria bacterium]